MRTLAAHLMVVALLGLPGCKKTPTEDPTADPKRHKPDEADQACPTSCGSGDACYAAGYQLLYGEGATAETKPQAAGCFRKACDQGRADACRGLAGMFDYGQGVPENTQRAGQFWSQAAKLHRTACDGGTMRDCFELGILMFRGQGINQDQPEAAKLYRAACDGGNANGCVELKLVCGGASYPACF